MYLLFIQIVVTPGVTGGIDCLMHLICDPGGGCGLFVYLFCLLICVLLKLLPCLLICDSGGDRAKVSGIERCTAQYWHV